MMTFQAQCWLPAEPDAVFDYCRSTAGFREHFPYAVRWHSKGGLWLEGDTLDFRYRYMGVWLPHKTRITELQPARSFTDVMERGLYRHFRHRHDFAPEQGGTRLTDTVEFSFGAGALVDRFLGIPTLRRAFAQRHQALQRRFGRESEHAGQSLS